MPAPAPLRAKRIQIASGVGSAQPAKALTTDPKGTRNLRGGAPLAKQRDQHPVALQRLYIVPKKGCKLRDAEPKQIGVWHREISVSRGRIAYAHIALEMSISPHQKLILRLKIVST
jgi:hypothetical protein